MHIVFAGYFSYTINSFLMEWDFAICIHFLTAYWLIYKKSVYKYTKGVMHVYINKYQCNNIYNLSKITACFNYWVCCIISVFNYYQQPYTILLDFHAILILKDFLFCWKKHTMKKDEHL